ncbi:glycerophosphodiester phosphodiesterase GDPD2-like isoform X2 [Rutidosis leptorrhynchoides]|uniref:glycerophosphodiester phosphodiesterase GDPD2-like isoform X2 n=1 Tax=Rutidosis leptorrhynchoides TaxID=125765 RepID=UPI003A993CAF
MAAVNAAIHVSDVPHLDQVNDNAAATLSLHATVCPTGLDMSHGQKVLPKFMVVGHRGHGMNVLQSTDKRMKAYKENSILSFNKAANYPLDYIEFDVQVTKDDTPVIFHDDFILSEENGTLTEKRITELTVDEFFSYGIQRETGQMGKSLLRKTNGNIVGWDVETDDHFCTLQEAFQNVNPCLGFNIELKFDDYVVYEEEYLIHVLQVILKVVYENAHERRIIFSTFKPDVALLMKKLQHTYPVYFLTNGGNEIYNDVRMNSLEEAKKLALEGGLDGIVSEVKGIFRNPSVVREINESNLSLLTYGRLK